MGTTGTRRMLEAVRWTPPFTMWGAQQGAVTRLVLFKIFYFLLKQGGFTVLCPFLPLGRLTQACVRILF